MKLHRLDQAREFYDRAGGYLLQQKSAHVLLLGILHQILATPERYKEPPYFAIAEDQGQPIAVALRTPPHPLLLSKTTDTRALMAIAQDLATSQSALSGVNALSEISTAFADIWQEFTGQTYSLKMALRLQVLTQVPTVPLIQGCLRQAQESDREILTQWQTDFALEVFHEPGKPAEIEQWLTSALAQGILYLWEDGVPVSMAGGNPLANTSGWIGPVYTPPKFRRQGYASSCVVALSQRLLAQGYQDCYLFTDVANPTSNKIYQAIGYQPAGDWHHYHFSASETQLH